MHSGHFGLGYSSLLLLGACVCLWSVASSGAEPPPPSYAKDIKPFLAKYCLECHGKKGKGGLDVSTHESFLKGGISFPGFVPGKPDESFAVILVEHKSKPVMPPGKSKQPTAAEKGLLRSWIAAGAKNDGGGARLPQFKRRQHSLALGPDGRLHWVYAVAWVLPSSLLQPLQEQLRIGQIVE